jgi:VWFA-related protein
MSSPEAMRRFALADTARRPFVRSFFPCLFLGMIALFVASKLTLAQDASPKASAPAAAQQSENKQNSEELVSHDEPTTFKVNVKLVVVRAVVRDSQGHAVGNLHKEDFQVFDKGKPQPITQFEVEQPGALAAKARQTSDEKSASEPLSDVPAPHAPAGPERFIAYVFDDVHLEFGDLSQVRNAAERHFSTLRPTDRAAIFTTSGLGNLDFTDDHDKLHAALFHLRPQPVARGLGHDCPDISYYQADLIINKNDLQATQVALQEAASCQPPIPGAPPPNPMPLVTTASIQALRSGEHESQLSLGILKDVVHNLSRMPGQRSLVLVSPGFIAPKMDIPRLSIVRYARKW